MKFHDKYFSLFCFGLLVMSACSKQNGGYEFSAVSDGKVASSSGGAIEPPPTSNECVEGALNEKIVFMADKVAHGESCKPEKIVQTCVSGVWSSFEPAEIASTHLFDSCQVDQPIACQDDIYGQLAHGEFTTPVDRFQKTAVEFPETCQSITVRGKCDNGKIEWEENPAYPALACVQGAPKDCKVGNTIIPHGGKHEVKKFKSRFVAFNQFCESQIRTAVCNNGILSGYSGSYNENDCRNLPEPKRYYGYKVVIGREVNSYERSLAASQANIPVDKLQKIVRLEFKHSWKYESSVGLPNFRASSVPGGTHLFYDQVLPIKICQFGMTPYWQGHIRSELSGMEKVSETLRRNAVQKRIEQIILSAIQSKNDFEVFVSPTDGWCNYYFAKIHQSK